MRGRRDVRHAKLHNSTTDSKKPQFWLSTRIRLWAYWRKPAFSLPHRCLELHPPWVTCLPEHAHPSKPAADLLTTVKTNSPPRWINNLWKHLSAQQTGQTVFNIIQSCTQMAEALAPVARVSNNNNKVTLEGTVLSPAHQVILQTPIRCKSHKAFIKALCDHHKFEAGCLALDFSCELNIHGKS